MRDEFLRRVPPKAEYEDRPPTRDVAELKAAALLSQARVVKPPVDVEMCARVAGIQLVAYGDLGKQSAVLSIVEGIVGVVVNSNESRVRQRFSLAHEIAHWILERKPVTHELRLVAARGRQYNAIERVCDYFAASLLMPRSWLPQRVAIGKTTGELAQEFQVSSAAMSARMRELGLVTQRGRLK